jgi:Na+-translocating ferredoxin:NAD+ oxidoreductase RnfG subunit
MKTMFLSRLPIRLLLALVTCALAGLTYTAQAQQLSEEEKQKRIKMLEKQVNDNTYAFLDKMGDMEKEQIQAIGPQLQRFFYQRQLIQAKMQAARKAAGDDPQKRRAAMMGIREEMTALYGQLNKSAKEALSKKDLKQFNKVLKEVAPQPGQGGGRPGGSGRGGPSGGGGGGR